MAITAQIMSDDRGSKRYAVGLSATLRDRITRPHDVTIEDLSLTGFRLSGCPELEVGSQVSIGFAGIGVHEARVTRGDGSGHGCEFVTPITREALAKALDAGPVAPIAFPTSSGQFQLADAPEPYVQPYPMHTKFTIAAVAAAVGWAVALGLYFTLA